MGKKKTTGKYVDVALTTLALALFSAEKTPEQRAVKRKKNSYRFKCKIKNSSALIIPEYSRVDTRDSRLHPLLKECAYFLSDGVSSVFNKDCSSFNS